MTVRKIVVTAAALLAVGLGTAGCHGSTTSTPSSSPNGAGELSGVQTTLDQIDSEMAGDGS